MMEEELERMKEASQTDPSIVVQPPARPPRHQKWKVVRMKGDKYVNADVAEVAHKIDSLEQQSSQGSFTPATRMDILSTAIGKPDFLDAVRGEPRGVSVAKYFGRRSRCSHDDDNPSPQLVAKIRANLVDEILAQVRGGKPNEDIKTMFAEGLKTYRQLIGSKDQGGPKWYYPKCTPNDGNAFFGDKDFDPKEWLLGLSLPAQLLQAKVKTQCGMVREYDKRGTNSSSMEPKRGGHFGYLQRQRSVLSEEQAIEPNV
ncbi:hypothetical protein K1719_009687 [Acacia pycnantha]|nr:hypothetical protein K1719_009687 [Acacia pycnantha]